MGHRCSRCVRLHVLCVVESMRDFGRWFQEQSLPVQPQETVPADLPMLPEGVFDRAGKYFATCRSCERDYELGYDPEEFNSDTNYCGGSPRCLP